MVVMLIFCVKRYSLMSLIFVDYMYCVFLYLRFCCKIVFFDVFKYFIDDVFMNEIFVYKFV